MVLSTLNHPTLEFQWVIENTDKPVGVEGYIRYNTDKKKFVRYGNNNWGSTWS